jgi:hypothetical protein
VRFARLNALQAVRPIGTAYESCTDFLLGSLPFFASPDERSQAMADNQASLPPGFKPWPPANAQDFVEEIKAGWGSGQGRHGKHWALQVFGENPISGYKVILKPTGAGDP